MNDPLPAPYTFDWTKKFEWIYFQVFSFCLLCSFSCINLHIYSSLYTFDWITNILFTLLVHSHQSLQASYHRKLTEQHIYWFTSISSDRSFWRYDGQLEIQTAQQLKTNNIVKVPIKHENEYMWVRSPLALQQLRCTLHWKLRYQSTAEADEHKFTNDIVLRSFQLFLTIQFNDKTLLWDKGRLSLVKWMNFRKMSKLPLKVFPKKTLLKSSLS